MCYLNKDELVLSKTILFHLIEFFYIFLWYEMLFYIHFSNSKSEVIGIYFLYKNDIVFLLSDLLIYLLYLLTIKYKLLCYLLLYNIFRSFYYLLKYKFISNSRRINYLFCYFYLTFFFLYWFLALPTELSNSYLYIYNLVITI